MSKAISYLKRIFSHAGIRKYGFNSMWMIGEKISRMVVALFVGVWVARYLGPSQFGILNYVLAFNAMFSVLPRLGLDSIVVRELVSGNKDKVELLGTTFWLKTVAAAVSFGIILIVSYSINEIDVQPLVAIVAFGYFFQAFDIFKFYYESKVQIKYVSIAQLFQLGISTIFKVYLIIFNYPLIWFVGLILFDSITIAITLLYIYNKQSNLQLFHYFKLSIAKRLLADSWPLIFSGVVIMIYMRIDQIMIKMMLGAEETGIYSAAVKLSEVWYFIPMIITTSIFPSIVKTKVESKALYQKRLQALYSFLVWMAICIAFIIMFFSDSIINTLYGSDYSQSAHVLKIHIWTGLFVFMGVAFSKFLIVENLTKISFYRTLSGAAINVVMNYLLINKYGIIGAAYATLAAQFSANYLFDFFNKNLHEHLIFKTRAVIRPISSLRGIF